MCEDWGEEFKVSLEKLIGKNEVDRERALQIKTNAFYQKHHVLCFPKRQRAMEESPRGHTLCCSQRNNL